MDKKMLKRIENINQREGLFKVMRKPWCKGKIWDDIYQVIKELEQEYDQLINNN